MTPDLFAATSEKSNVDNEAVNPCCIRCFGLANTIKQEQQKTNAPTAASAAASGRSPNDTLQADKQKSLDMLNIVNSTIIEEQNQAKVRLSFDFDGSSPSREVQAILSLKDNDCLNEYYDSGNILLDKTDGIGSANEELKDLENEIIDDLDDDKGYNFKYIDDDDK
ncbi:hypothetical protein pipiens_002914 [Culex pipiens pipiens]|uniref:Uncharacterized protein n=1 Tax=Culex pipiens pipiens TaxID=38569 RepID=A0ABD1D7N0_CULPP